MKATTEFPDDPALPGLAAIRAVGLAGAIPALGLDDGPVQLLLCGYTPGSRATLDARVGRRRFAVKVYAADPAPEAELYEALAAALGDGGCAGVRAPTLLAWERDLRTLVTGWLDGPAASKLIKGGQGTRAGDLAARWLQCAASLPVKLGPPFGVARMLERAHRWAADLAGADPVLGAAATALARSLARTQPAEGAPRLVHGSLHARHILDAGDGPGLIDWRNFGQGPAELDAAAFLATLRRSALRHELVAGEATRAEEALLAGTAGLLDERALVWHRAAALLRLAHKKVSFGMGDRLAGAHALVAEATRLAERAARPVSVARRKTPAFSLNFPALELVLQALSTRPATPDELDQLRKLLDETRDRTT